MVARALEDVDGRGLFFKGPTAQTAGLRPRKVSSDVDVLVARECRNDLIALLRASGWGPRPSGGAHGVAPTHAITLIHPQWPIDIDVHERVPGCDQSPDAVFDCLWSSRTSMELAHTPLPVPSRIDHALLLALNALRSPWDPTSTALLESLPAALSVDDASALLQRAHALGAAASAAPFLRPLVGSDAGPFQTPSREWVLYQHMEHPAVTWLAALEETPWRKRPALLLAAILPSRALMAKRNIQMSQADGITLTRERLRRLASFTRRAYPAFRAYMDFKRSLRARSRNPQKH